MSSKMLIFTKLSHGIFKVAIILFCSLLSFCLNEEGKSWSQSSNLILFNFVELCKIGSDEQNEWYFFSHKDKKYPTGTRTNRATKAGFWKATGRDKAIYSRHSLIGMRKTLVFYKGRAPNGQKSDWIMHEYRLETNENGTPQASITSLLNKMKFLFTFNCYCLTKWRNHLFFLQELIQKKLDKNIKTICIFNRESI